jgi:hypothetical protein
MDIGKDRSSSWIGAQRQKCGDGYEGARVMPCSSRIPGAHGALWAEVTRALRQREVGPTEHAFAEHRRSSCRVSGKGRSPKCKLASDNKGV